jgi:hypothetical protein
MSRESMLKLATPRLDMMHGRGKYTIFNLKMVKNMILVEYYDQYKKAYSIMFGVR